MPRRYWATRADYVCTSRVPSVVTTASSVVWDFDGVVADTEPVQAAAYEATLERFSIQPERRWFNNWVGTPEHRIWAGLREQFGLSQPVEVLTAERAGIYGELALKLQPAWFVTPVLSMRCSHRVVSAGNHHQIEMLLNHWGIRDAFTSISATGSPDGDGRDKAERLVAALEPCSVLFEDSPRYLTLAAGHRRVGVHHQFNDLAGLPCDVLVSHASVGVWQSLSCNQAI